LIISHVVDDPDEPAVKNRKRDPQKFVEGWHAGSYEPLRLIQSWRLLLR
jgi:hypothetical protein